MFPFGPAAYANVAMPGLFLAGAGRTPTNAASGLGLAVEHVQMVRELVVAQLYDGYAVVRGQYWFYNSHPDSIWLSVGFPVDAYSENVYRDGRESIYLRYDDLYSMRVIVNGVKLESPPDYQAGAAPSESDSVDRTHSWLAHSDWRVWQQWFAGHDTTAVTIYYIIRTTAPANEWTDFPTFGYVVESGSVWAGNIQEARVVVQMLEGQTVDDLKTVHPESRDMRASEDGRILSYAFFNLEPTVADNLIIGLNNSTGQQLGNIDSAYAAIDRFAAHLPPHNSLEDEYDADWKNPRRKGIGSGFAFLLVIASPVLLLFLVAIILVFIVIARKKAPEKPQPAQPTAAAPPPHTPPPAGGDHPA